MKAVHWLEKNLFTGVSLFGPSFISYVRVGSIDRVRSRRIRAGQFDVSRIVRHVLVMVTRRYNNYISLRRR